MTTDITTAINAEIATIDASIAEMTARRAALTECRSKLEPQAVVSDDTKPQIKPTGAKIGQGSRKARRAELTADDIRCIRDGAANGFSHNDMRGWLDDRVSRSTISNIVNRKGYYAKV